MDLQQYNSGSWGTNLDIKKYYNDITTPIIFNKGETFKTNSLSGTIICTIYNTGSTKLVNHTQGTISTSTHSGSRVSSAYNWEYLSNGTTRYFRCVGNIGYTITPSLSGTYYYGFTSSDTSLFPTTNKTISLTSPTGTLSASKTITPTASGRLVFYRSGSDASMTVTRPNAAYNVQLSTDMGTVDISLGGDGLPVGYSSPVTIEIPNGATEFTLTTMSGDAAIGIYTTGWISDSKTNINFYNNGSWT